LIEAGLPEPIIEEDMKGLRITFLKDIYTEDYLKTLDLSERQIKAILYIKQYGKITNTDYQTLNRTSHRTAARDLQELVERLFIDRKGTTGKGTYYVLRLWPGLNSNR
jgi:ATP-dependent DNA helicase RecG